YLENVNKFFQKCDKEYSISKQNDGPPDGLDFDLLLFTQEPEEVLNNFNNLKISLIGSTSKSKKTVKLQSVQNNLIFSVISISGKCLVDSIKFQSKY
ncbi:MAG TPA: hypothetical protein VGG71_14720, partial [Chitinophagaceae bacterium]